MLYQIQQQLYSLAQGSDDFPSYFTKLSKIWDELRAIQNILACSYASSVSINKFLEDQKLIQMLMGLNDSYKVLRGQILMMKPLPTISTTYSMILQEERQRGITVSPTLNSDAIDMHVSSDNISNTSKKFLVSTHCKKNGHTKSQCYRLNGFPAHFKFTKSKRDDSKSIVQNVTTMTAPTISSEQYEQLLQLLNVNNISHSQVPNQVNSSITEGAMDDEGNYFSFSKFASNVYKSKALMHSHYSWIIDISATHHICSNSSLFLFMNKIPQLILIGLPNRHTTSVSYIGDVQIHNNIILHGVFYMPSFKYNLVSITKFTTQLQTFVIFTDTKCFV